MSRKIKFRKLSKVGPGCGHATVLIYTANVDFGGQQYFRVRTEDLIRARKGNLQGEDRIELATHSAATHWAEDPFPEN